MALPTMTPEQQAAALVKAKATREARKAELKALGVGTLQQQVNAMCKQCIYDPKSGQGTWRQQVTACTSTECPLYHYRPISKPNAEA